MFVVLVSFRRSGLFSFVVFGGYFLLFVLFDWLFLSCFCFCAGGERLFVVLVCFVLSLPSF